MPLNITQLSCRFKMVYIDGVYNSKANLPFGLELRAERLLPNFETTWQGALLEGHKQKKIPMPLLEILSRYLVFIQNFPVSFQRQFSGLQDLVHMVAWKLNLPQ